MPRGEACGALRSRVDFGKCRVGARHFAWLLLGKVGKGAVRP